MVTVAELKKQYKTIANAKLQLKSTRPDILNLKSRIWQDLCDFLNGVNKPYHRMTKTELINTLKQRDIELEQNKSNKQTTNTVKETVEVVPDLNVLVSDLNTYASNLDILLSDLVYNRGVGSNEIFESKEALKDEAESDGKDDWQYFASTLKRRYYRLSKLYHPDTGGTEEQMNNLKRAYDTAMMLVEANKGINL